MTVDIKLAEGASELFAVPFDCSDCKCSVCQQGPFYGEPCPHGVNCSVCSQNSKSDKKISCPDYKIPTPSKT